MQYNKLEDSETKDGKPLINYGGGSVSITEGQIMTPTDDPSIKRKKYIKWGIIGGVALIVVILAIVLPLVLIKKHVDPGHDPLPPGEMNPYQSIPGSQKHQGSGSSVSGLLLIDVNGMTQEKLAEKAMKAIPIDFLQREDQKILADPSKKLGVDWRNKNFFGPNNQLKGNLSYLIDVVAPTICRMVLTEANDTRYTIPWNMVQNRGGDPTMRLDMHGFHLYDDKTENFGFQFHDVADPTNILLDTINQTLILSDKYIQMDFKLPSQKVYGFGDRVHEFKLSEGAFTMWASGQDGVYDDGRGRGGLSGVHPFLLVQTKNPRRYFGLFFRNSNAMTPVLRFNADGTSVLSFITIGGQLEMYFFSQGTAHEVIQMYQAFVSLPKLPPFWALGWQEASPNPSAIGGNDQAAVAQALTNYWKNGLPLEAVYLQADSWDQTNDFTLDTGKFPKINDLAATIKAANQRLVAYVDAAVNVKDRAANKAYINGKKVDGFIKTTINDKSNPDGYLLNSKSGKNVVYVDWLNSQSADYWGAQVKNYQQNVPYDGLWTTMNEPFGDIAGEIDAAQTEQVHRELESESQAFVGDSEESSYDQSWFYSYWPLDKISTYILPFVPELVGAGNYDENTLSLNASHANGYRDYDVHSLYSHAMMNATVNGILSIANNDNRPFILTKGSFSATGGFTATVAHTQNERSWDSLYFSLASVLRSQMFGMPHSGADVCGFKSAGDALDEELCLRWYQLATFFPLARHSQDSTGPRTEPFNFKNAVYAAQVKKTMHDRMQYLRLMYTCLFETSDSGGTCLDPIQFRYVIPDNKWNKGQLPDFTTQFMFAGSLLVSPIMNSTGDKTTFQAYFPKGNWVNMANWAEIIQGNDDYATLQVRDTVNAHLAPGAVIPFQNNSDMTLMTTTQALAKPISLIANRDVNGQAGGSLFLDQGISLNEMRSQLYEYYNIQVQANSVQVEPTNFDKGTQPHQLDQIVLVNAADLAEGAFACYYRPDSLEPQPLTTEYSAARQALFIRPTGAFKFSDVLNVYYGSSNNGDVNMCNQHTWNYNIVGGVPVIAGLKNINLNLTHMAGTLNNIAMSIGFFDTGIINVKWTWDNQEASQRIPLPVPKNIVDTTPRDQSKIMDTLDKYIIITDQPFQIQFLVKLTAKPETILTIKGLIFDEYLNWINVQANAMPAASDAAFKGIFGLGERASKDFFFKSGVYSMFSKDIDNPVENGKLPGKNDYGVHPFYMFKHAPNSYVGVYHNNAQAQDWWIKNDFTTGNISISTIATGGLGDMFIILSMQRPESVISKYHSIIGTPVLTPQWALGWSQCRWCYQNLGDVKTSMQGYIDNGIPLDTQWVDIDYMQDYQDFTYNQFDGAGGPGSFSGLPDFVNDLHKQNMKFIPIVDAGVSYRPGQGYKAFDEGVKDDIFMKISGNTFVGKVWPNEASYPDFFHPKAQTYWSGQLDSFHQSVAFDGLWQDMNEASNFCNGICHHDPLVASPVSYKLPYTPTGESLETKAISLDVAQVGGYTQLDAHSLFGTQQVRASSLWFAGKNQRPMIISRSSYAGMGKYGSQWLGDNHATVEDMELSVIGIMNMNIFGIPLVGADICGFGGPSTTPDLCARWHALGGFYPFSRNHRACWGDSQEPWRFEPITYKPTGQSYMDLMKTSIQRKYSLIRYFYTQMTQISLNNNTFTTIYKPLFFEFPDDAGAYENIANNVMIGPAIKTSVNAKSITDKETDFYFPEGTWCSLFEPIGECIYSEEGENVTLGSQIHESYAHLREGFVVPMQNASKLNARTTYDLQQQPVDFHILGSFRVPGLMAWSAAGLYLNDDGLTTVISGNVNQYRLNAIYSQSQGESLTITVSQLMTATNFQAADNCTAVNKADYMQSIYVYNATAFKAHDTFWVSVAYNSDINNYVNIGMASFDAVTNRIIYDGSILGNLLCLSNVFRIVFKNLS